ncbi:hypothetical protein AM629_01950 [Photorhabdus heterorhabditis]|uniref:Uncharacterized protein n=1 Tax=Photorhabdus heterorhabditis TaxID=880156 RepID=A0ABR5KGP6_9GAMM|nr:hypothetical protein [Photorhabdus heterorhabditis]KOY63590.1 hypothetical protein AM629_01950 [Photorhabdus heterorhabditis]
MRLSKLSFFLLFLHLFSSIIVGMILTGLILKLIIALIFFFLSGDFDFTQEDFLLCLKVGAMGGTIGGIGCCFIYYREYNSRK